MNKFNNEIKYIVGALVNYYIIPCALFSFLYKGFRFNIADGITWMMMLGWLLQLIFSVLYGKTIQKGRAARGIFMSVVIGTLLFFPAAFGKSVSFELPPELSVYSVFVLPAIILLTAVGTSAGYLLAHGERRPRIKKHTPEKEADDVFN